MLFEFLFYYCILKIYTYVWVHIWNLRWYILTLKVNFSKISNVYFVILNKLAEVVFNLLFFCKNTVYTVWVLKIVKLTITKIKVSSQNAKPNFDSCLKNKQNEPKPKEMLV